MNVAEAARWGESRPGRRIVLALILALSAGLPIILAWATGSLSIPHNDAWALSKIAQGFARSGEFRLLGWGRTALAGQVMVLGPLGESIVVQHLFVAGLSVVALGATYAFLVCRVGSAGALLGTAIVGSTPEFGLLATSFMTDMPAFAALMVCLLLTDVALRTGKSAWLAAALVVGVWGVTIREQALVGPVVAVVVAALACRGRKRLTVIGFGLVAFAATVGFEVWRQSLPRGDSPRFVLDLDGLADTALRAVFTSSLYVAPAVLLVARPIRWTARIRWISAVVLVSSLAIVACRSGDVFLGNYLSRDGAYSGVAVGVRSVIPVWHWFGLLLLGCLSLASLVGAFLHAGVRMDRTSLLVGLLLMAGTMGQAALGQTIYSRYLLPLIPVLCVPILRCSNPPGGRLALPALAVLFVTSIAITSNALAFDAARWSAASFIQERGVRARDIDAGLEWVGYHATGPAVQDSTRPEALAWYMSMFEHSRACYVISASPLKGRSEIGTYDYSTYAVIGHSQLWIYEETPCR
jgi:hypothetical protein